MPYYIDFDNKSSARGTDGLTPTNYRNENDILDSGVTTPNVNGDVVYVRGQSNTLSSICGFDFTAMHDFIIQPYDDTLYDISTMAPFLVLSEVDEDPFSYAYDYVLRRMITNIPYYYSPSLLEGCFIAPPSGGSFFMNVTNSDHVMTVRGCTFVGDISLIQYISNTYELTINFYGCVFVNTELNSSVEYNNVNFYNCLFLGKTQSEVTANYSPSGSSSSFDDDCEFDLPVPANMATSAGDIAGYGGIESIEFDQVAGDLYAGSQSYDYSADGNGLFNGERRAPGAWFFSNTYYVDLDDSAVSGNDGMYETSPISRAEAYTLDTVAIDGRLYRNGDRFLLINNLVAGSAETVAFPFISTKAMGESWVMAAANTGEPAQKTYVEPVGDFVTIDLVTNSADMTFGKSVVFSRIAFYVDEIGVSDYAVELYFRSCVFFNPTSIRMMLTDLYSPSGRNSQFLGCTFVTPIIYIDGLSASQSEYMSFFYCLFAAYSSGVCSIDQTASPNYVSLRFRECEFTDTYSNLLSNFSSSSSYIDYGTLGDYHIVTLLQQFPLLFTQYEPSELQFWDYDFQLQLVRQDSSDQSYYDGSYSEPFDFGIQGIERVGVGAFYFFGDEPYPYNYYVDFEKVASGTGTELDPFNKSQVQDFFDLTMSIPHYDGDSLICKGVATIDSPVFIETKLTTQTYIRSWDPDVNGNYILEIDPSLSASDVEIFRFTAPSLNGGIYPDIFVDDAIILAPTDSCSSLRLYRSYYPMLIQSNISFRDCLIIADIEEIMLSDTTGGFIAGMNFLGCSMSFGSNVNDFTWKLDAWGLPTYIHNSVVAFHGIPTAYDIDDDDVYVYYSEFNQTQSALGILSTRESDNVYGNTDVNGPEKLPESLTSGDYDVNDFKSTDYVIENQGNPEDWPVNLGIPYGLSETERQGIGAFYFINTTGRDFYVDFSKVISGTGTELDPWGYSDWNSYWGGSGDPAPESYDRLHTSGLGNWYIGDFIASGALPDNLTIDSWDIPGRGIAKINIDDAPGSAFDIISATSVGSIILKDLVIIFNSGGINRVNTVNVSSGDAGDVSLKNILFILNDIDIFIGDVGDQIDTLECYGLTWSTLGDLILNPDGKTSITTYYSAGKSGVASS